MNEVIETSRSSKIKENSFKVLRWIGVLPGAILAYFLGYILVKGFSWLSNKMYDFGENGWYAVYIIPCIAAGVSGYAFVQYGKIIAPAYKKETAFVLLIICAMVMGICIFLGSIRGYTMGILESIVTVIGGVMGLFNEDDN